MLYIIIIQFVFIILLYNLKKISNKRKFLNVFEIFSYFKNKKTKTSTKCISMFKLSNKSTVRIYDHTKQPPIICLTNQSTDRPSICPSMHPSSTTMYERSIDCTINRSLYIQNVWSSSDDLWQCYEIQNQNRNKILMPFKWNKKTQYKNVCWFFVFAKNIFEFYNCNFSTTYV